ncbi:17-beta-hydroxysteroid dehydrogenase [Xylariales sp. AK1849]|nr:17-beta-hydroxysteroid dehydrogenase [Xylariales sp. AK1849]
MGFISSPHMPFRLDGKVALVTGSGRGVGAAIAVELGRAGAKFVQEIKSLGSGAVALQANVSQVKDTIRLFDEAVAHFGHLDIACSNAGVVSFGHLEDEEFDRVFTINTRGQFFVAREAYKHLSEKGRIILLSSNTANRFTVPNHSIYSASKAAIECFEEDYDQRHRSWGTMTDMFYAVARHYIPNRDNFPDAQLEDIAAHASPLHRNGYPIDLAHTVVFMASKEGEWVNGKAIGIDGGAC